MSYKTALFGGALLAAGMSANAEEFTFVDASGAYVSNAQSCAYGASPYCMAATAPAALDTSRAPGSTAYLGGVTTSATQAADSVRVDAMWDGAGGFGYGFGGSRLQQVFTVDSAAGLEIAWEALGTIPTGALTTGAFFSAFLMDLTAGGPPLFTLDGDETDPTTWSGLETFSLIPGNTYVVNISMTGGSGNVTNLYRTDPVFMSATVVPQCPCDTSGDGTIDVLDLLSFLTAWFSLEPAADFNGGGVDVTDLLDYLTCWFPATEGAC